jgi:hypothetical protein
MSLADLANLAETVGIFAILFGIVFGLIQLRQARIQRRELAILECARSSKADFDELGAHYEAAAIRVGMKFETMGLLVHRGVIPLDAMSDLVGGAALTIWSVTQDWCEETRKYRSHPTFWEWYQWLVERLQERDRQGREPVFLTEANWREPKI